MWGMVSMSWIQNAYQLENKQGNLPVGLISQKYIYFDIDLRLSDAGTVSFILLTKFQIHLCCFGRKLYQTNHKVLKVNTVLVTSKEKLEEATHCYMGVKALAMA